MTRTVIFGGTGTLGRALAKILHGEITVVSRCEIKQKEMKKEFPDIKFVVGDIASDTWMAKLQGPYGICYNLAAMKHVEVCEDNVESCIRTNLMGTINTYDWARSNCDRYVFSSTDKAVLPINAYGYAKALSVKYLMDMNKIYENVSICAWGNVMASRGSVIHAFKKSLLEDGVVRITDTRMTRFWINIEDVADFMAYKSYETTVDELHIPEMKASKVLDLAHATADVLGVKKFDVEVIGIRPGEKLHECLRTGHDYCLTSNTCAQYSYDELKEIVRRSLNV